MTVDLSEQQRRALREQPDGPLEVVDRDTNRSYVLVAREEYERTRTSAAEDTPADRREEMTAQIPPGIRRSQEAYWRDLPSLLPLASRRRQWVAYHGDEQIGFGRTETELYQECLRRGLNRDEFYIDRLRWSEYAPWEAEEIESPMYDYVEVDDDAEDSGPSAVAD